MYLYSQSIRPVPPETVRASKAAFVQGNYPLTAKPRVSQIETLKALC